MEETEEERKMPSLGESCVFQVACDIESMDSSIWIKLSNGNT